ncbi:hypothetical protein AWV80_04050 [Cupriavidus sp. UYMU48A]|nr:hypothetical protein AWV80_04050 [Cupriavidus sp. UYMU48A]
MDVEHYRPKGGVADDSTHRGYWWLALEWSNLLPSCIDCNRSRRQFIFKAAGEGQLPELGQAKELVGKQDAFPITSPPRASQPGDDLEREGPLLIDPTVTDPALHLTWDIRSDPETSHPLLAPRQEQGVEDLSARRTIDVLGLNRQGLVEERHALLLELAVEIEGIRELLTLAAELGNEPAMRKLIENAKERIHRLRRHALRDRRYSSMAAAFIAREKNRLEQDFRTSIGTIGR